MVYQYLLDKYPDFCAKIEEHQVKYVKVAPEEDDPTSALGRSWKSMYNVQTKEKAEEVAASQGSTLEWLEGGNCRIISQTLPAVRVSSNGKKAFHNQVIAAYTGWIDSRNDPKKAVRFGDDSLLPHEVLEDVSQWMVANRCAYRWTPGRFVIVDNSTTFHSRQPFTGRRRVYASIGKGTKPVTDTTTHLILKSGDKMPSAGLGLWKMPKETCADAVYNAIKAGYRLFDSACDYGNEEQTGQGLKRAIDEGIVKREDLFIVSKLWNTFHQPQHVKLAAQKSLADLGLDYLDLYLIHFPIPLQFVPIETRYPPEWIHDPSAPSPRLEPDTSGVTYQQTYQAMEELVKEGLVSNIGCSNIGAQTLRQVLQYATVKPAVLQIEAHPFNTQEKLIRYARENEVQVMAFSNLGHASYTELGMATAEDSCMDLPLIKDIAAKYSKTTAQVILRWGVQRGTTVIPKTSNPDRLAENFDLFSFSLNNEEMNGISALNKNKRFNDPGVFAEAAFGFFYPIYE